MSDGINSRFYQFLATEKDWVKSADKDGDNAVSQGEFREFILGSDFNWVNEDSTNAKTDLINNFFRSIDKEVEGKIGTRNISNNQALSSAEIDAMNNKIEVYEKLNEYIKTLKAPEGLNGQFATGWLNEVKLEIEKLAEGFTGKPEDLVTYLETNFNPFNITVTWVKAQVLADTQEAHKHLNWNVYEDAILADRMEVYIQTGIDGTESALALKEGFEAVVIGYKASNATGSTNSNNSTTGTESTGGNSATPEYTPLKRAEFQNTLTQATKTDEELKPLFESHPELMNNAVQDFLADLPSGITTDNIVSEFKGSDPYTKAKTSVENLQKFDEYISSTEFFTSLGESENGINKKIMNMVQNDDIRYLDKYEEIIEEAKTRVLNGEFQNEGSLNKVELLEFIVNQIKANIVEFYEYDVDGKENLTVEDYKEIYEIQKEIAEDKKEDKNAYLKLHKQAAITYLEGVANISANNKAIVEEILGGSNISSIINACQKPSKVLDYVETVQNNSGIKNIVKVEDKTDKFIKELFKNSSTTVGNVYHDSIRTTYGIQVNNNKISVTMNQPTPKTVGFHKDSTVTFSFRTTVAGGIDFVDYGSSTWGNTYGVWADDCNWVNGECGYNDFLNCLFKDKVRSDLEYTYDAELKAIGLTPEELRQLFFKALFVTITDTSVVKNQYEEVALLPVIEKLAENYQKMLKALANDENKQDFLTNESLFMGATPFAGGTQTGEGGETYKLGENYYTYYKTLDKYYINDSTQGGNDWIKVDKTTSSSVTVEGYTGSILLMNSQYEGDNTVVNNAMKLMLQDYIIENKEFIEPAKIIALFKQAQQTAFTNMQETLNQSNPNGTKIYGYAESDGASLAAPEGEVWSENYDTARDFGENGGMFYSASTLLLNIMYEMEKLLYKEVFGL